MLRPRIQAITDHALVDELACSDGQFFEELIASLRNEPRPAPMPASSFRYSIVSANGKSKRYSTRRSAAWKAVSSNMVTFKGSGYGSR